MSFAERNIVGNPAIVMCGKFIYVFSWSMKIHTCLPH